MSTSAAGVHEGNPHLLWRLEYMSNLAAGVDEGASSTLAAKIDEDEGSVEKRHTLTTLVILALMA